MGYSRQQFCEIRRNYQTYGADGLIDRLPGAQGLHPNPVSAEVEAANLARALDQPSHGALRVAWGLSLKGIHVSAAIPGFLGVSVPLCSSERVPSTAQKGAEFGAECTLPVSALGEMPYLTHFRKVEGYSTSTEQPAERGVIIGLSPVPGGLLVDTNGLAVSARACDVAVRNLIRAHCSIRRTKPDRKRLPRDVQERRTFPTSQQDRILFRQQVSCLRERRKDERVISPLKQL